MKFMCTEILPSSMLKSKSLPKPVIELTLSMSDAHQCCDTLERLDVLLPDEFNIIDFLLQEDFDITDFLLETMEELPAVHFVDNTSRCEELSDLTDTNETALTKYTKDSFSIMDDVIHQWEPNEIKPSPNIFEDLSEQAVKQLDEVINKIQHEEDLEIDAITPTIGDIFNDDVFSTICSDLNLTTFHIET